jgi:hypothetical protein
MTPGLEKEDTMSFDDVYPAQIVIRPMREEDMVAITRIEANYFRSARPAYYEE